MDALLQKNDNFEISVKDIDFFVVSHYGHLSGFSEALYAAMGKKGILEHSFRCNTMMNTSCALFAGSLCHRS
jgi:hypothetical protein